ncbi:TonB-dependent siderophore receptor [Selenomonas sp. F0473]|uniref:TonB-dependent receptor plug domain-containing protein n=1 Tax=Selenomonas sp. F0473 TaxID=999423 RepID=UPI00029E3636|nr:TonB-dependent receptor [Selenomonas sp. F0473]EKU71019.1 hypothetical protein HMPREF9161_01113 [Selenomonas sp. F0473]
MAQNKKERLTLCALLSLSLCAGTAHAYAAETAEKNEETKSSRTQTYVARDIEVEGNTSIDYFGNAVTEQSYYRTGGDVNVIDRETLERRHYDQLSDALRQVPGVQIKTPGYRGGEFGYTQTHNIVTINGDDRVVVLVDGRRMDNTAGSAIASTSSHRSKAMVDINQITNIDNIEKIEVIKGPGGSFYGSDATGGVINIITRKGGDRATGTLDLSTGSWGRHNYRFNYSGSTAQGKMKYFFSLGREMGGDAKYKDGLSGKNYTYVNTGYKEEYLNFRFDYDFDKLHTLRAAYNHMQSDADYPLTAPDHKYFNQADWDRIKHDYFDNKITGDPKNPGYRTLWYMWAVTGSYNAYNKNNTDLTYIFNRENGMESFVRIYDQNERYWGSFGGRTQKDSPVPDTPEWYEWGRAHYRDRSNRHWFHQLKNQGIQFQVGKAYGKHDVLTTWTYDHSKYFNTTVTTGKQASVKRNSVIGYIQDKILLSDKWELTPSLRFAHYSDGATVSQDGVRSTVGSTTNTITPSLNTQYALDRKTTAYFGYSKVRRPLRPSDYTAKNDTDFAKLQDEKGDVWSIGIRREFSAKTTASIHYNYTRMSNAVVRYSVWDQGIDDFKLKFVNAKEIKKAVNLSLQHRFNPHLTLTASYSHAYDNFSAKDGMIFDPELKWADGNVNSVINRLRPANNYTADLAYENDKLYATITSTWYTGCDTMAYTARRAFILDLNANYAIHKDLTIYASIVNLTNQAYQTVYTSYLGKGAWPQLGRHFMIGMKYKF